MRFARLHLLAVVVGAAWSHDVGDGDAWRRRFGRPEG